MKVGFVTHGDLWASPVQFQQALLVEKWSIRLTLVLNNFNPR